MNYYQEFNGYGKELTKLLTNKINRMVDFASVNSDAFENKYGTGPVRSKLYWLGACEGLLLDDLMPSWKEKIFGHKVYLSDLLKASVNLTPSQLQQYLEAAKRDYYYDKALADKQLFEKDGERYAQQKVDKILKTDKTLVIISYADYVDRAYLNRFTPFGVTKVNQSITIFDLVPVLIVFKEGVKLDMRQALPVIIDKEKKQVAFAIDSAPSTIKLIDGNKFDNTDFLLSGADMEISTSGNVVEIKFRK
jgi:hypothetical protein